MSDILLSRIARERGLARYPAFRREYRRTAQEVGHPDHDVSERQFQRWLSGSLTTAPRNAAADTLERLFGHSVDDLFAPSDDAVMPEIEARVRRDMLAAMERDARARGLASAFARLRQGAYAGYEQLASTVRVFQPMVFPGPLQTPDYARALFAARRPAFPPAEIERRVADRTARGSLIEGPDAPRYRLVVGEAVLHTPIGGPDVQRAQLAHVAQLAELAHVEVQVVPTAAGAHAALSGPFQIYEVPDTPSVVFLEAAGEGIYLDGPEDVETFAVRFGHLREQALGFAESAQLIERATRQPQER